MAIFLMPPKLHGTMIPMIVNRFLLRLAPHVQALYPRLLAHDALNVPCSLQPNFVTPRTLLCNLHVSNTSLTATLVLERPNVQLRLSLVATKPPRIPMTRPS